MLALSFLASSLVMASKVDWGSRTKLGLGGIVTEEERGAYSGVVVPFERLEGLGRSGAPYNSWAPPLGAVGFDMGFLIGFGARVDVVEALDFVLGIFTIDILGDDRGIAKEQRGMGSELERDPEPKDPASDTAAHLPL